MKKIVIIFLASIIFAACNQNEEKEISKIEYKMNSIAEQYVKLILKIGQHDPDYVDAYYGPDDWKPVEQAVKGDSASIQNLYDEAGSLLDSLDALADYEASELETLRFKYLYKQLLSARSRLFMLAGGEFTFDEEAKNLYDAEVPKYSAEHFQSVISKLDSLLPGNSSLTERVNSFKEDFVIPKEKLDTVFRAAINEARVRTQRFINLPKNENFNLSYVTDKPWSGYNWYKGNGYSVIEINTDLPIYIDRAVDLAAHEGYPGHHVYNALLEKNLVKEKGWVEFSVYPLFSPQSLIAEGTANFGIEMAFPGEERIAFEKNVLFPLAGISKDRADKYYQVEEILSQLSYAGNEAARNYLNGKWNKEQTVDWLMKYSLSSKERAEQRIKFIEKYRSYVINYNLGQDIVKDYIERNGGTAANEKRRWELFERLLSTPQTPGNLIRR